MLSAYFLRKIHSIMTGIVIQGAHVKDDNTSRNFSQINFVLLYIHQQLQYIFISNCSIYSSAVAVYIHQQMQYIFISGCSIYSSAVAVYIRFHK